MSCKHMLKLSAECQDLTKAKTERIKRIFCGALCNGTCKPEHIIPRAKPLCSDTSCNLHKDGLCQFTLYGIGALPDCKYELVDGKPVLKVVKE